MDAHTNEFGVKETLTVSYICHRHLEQFRCISVRTVSIDRVEGIHSSVVRSPSILSWRNLREDLLWTFLNECSRWRVTERAKRNSSYLDVRLIGSIRNVLFLFVWKLGVKWQLWKRPSNWANAWENERNTSIHVRNEVNYFFRTFFRCFCLQQVRCYIIVI